MNKFFIKSIAKKKKNSWNMIQFRKILSHTYRTVSRLWTCWLLTVIMSQNIDRSANNISLASCRSGSRATTSAQRRFTAVNTLQTYQLPLNNNNRVRYLIPDLTGFVQAYVCHWILLNKFQSVQVPFWRKNDNRHSRIMT